MIADETKYRELVALYGSYGDSELVGLGRGMADLTETAQQALKEEIARRGLTVTPAPKPAAPEILDEDDLAHLRAYAASAPPECTFEFEDGHGATAAYLALTEEDIAAVVISGENAALDLRGPRVVVAPQDAERAAEILSLLVNDRFTQETGVVDEDFALPRCPACGMEEAMLESVEPTNQWRCAACDHLWLEEAATPAE
jgi:hypothetical protein